MPLGSVSSKGTAAWLVAPGFERVAEVFASNFAVHGEVGAAFAAVLDGEPVVDLWGGDAAPSRSWQEDTLTLIFSGTKGLVAACLLMLIDRGQLALGDPVSKHWPEFAANGKRDVVVAEVVSHRARLPGMRESLREEDLIDDVRMASLLAWQAPEMDARAAHAYHAATFGWLCGELIRRVTGRSVGQFFAEEVARPLGLELWIGLPELQEQRVSTLTYAPSWGSAPYLDDTRLAMDDLMTSIWANPPLFPADHIYWNRRQFHAAEIPGVNAIGTARSIARLYGCLARGGELEGVRLLAPETVDLGRRELSRFHDPFTDMELVYGAGFQLQTEPPQYGPPKDAFGHAGAGGSIHAAWPQERVGLSYVMTQMRHDPDGDPRSQALLSALHDAVR